MIPRVLLILTLIFIFTCLVVSFMRLSWGESVIYPYREIQPQERDFYYWHEGILYHCSLRVIPGLLYWVCFDVYNTPTPSAVPYDHY